MRNILALSCLLASQLSLSSTLTIDSSLSPVGERYTFLSLSATKTSMVTLHVAVEHWVDSCNQYSLVNTPTGDFHIVNSYIEVSQTKLMCRDPQMTRKTLKGSFEFDTDEDGNLTHRVGVPRNATVSGELVVN